MPHLLLCAFEHIHQAPRVAMCARDMVLWHIKSGDCHIWLCYSQLLAHTLEDIQIMVIMEYICIKHSPRWLSATSFHLQSKHSIAICMALY